MGQCLGQRIRRQRPASPSRWAADAKARDAFRIELTGCKHTLLKDNIDEHVGYPGIHSAPSCAA